MLMLQVDNANVTHGHFQQNWLLLTSYDINCSVPYHSPLRNITHSYKRKKIYIPLSHLLFIQCLRCANVTKWTVLVLHRGHWLLILNYRYKNWLINNSIVFKIYVNARASEIYKISLRLDGTRLHKFCYSKL